MKCTKCGYECENDFTFCPGCGQPAAEQPEAAPSQQTAPQPMPNASEYAVPNPVAGRMLSMFKDTLFLVVCILQSASVLFSICKADFPILGILFTIFLWLIYAQGRKNIADAKFMRYVSGTVFAQYVIKWVVCGLLAFFGLIFTALFSVIANTEFFDYIVDEFNKLASGYSSIIVSLLSSVAAVVGILMIVIAIGVALVNIFGTRSIHRFTQSLYRSAECGNLVVVKKNTAQCWFMVFGVLNGISALGNLAGNALGFLASGCAAAVYILAYLLVKKYFADCNA